MSKRALLWTLGGLAFFFTYLAAANAGKVIPAVPGISPERFGCRTVNFFGWFSGDCSDLLPRRFAQLAMGAAVLAVVAYFAGRDRSPRPSTALRARNGAGRPGAQASNSWGRVVPPPSHGETPNTYGLETAPRAVEESVTPSPNAIADNGHVEPAADYKTCPDCAEEVRAAARKCRFCGYMFADEQVPSQT